MFALKEAVRHLDQPRWYDRFRLARMVRYLWDTASYALHLEHNGDLGTVAAYSDADWAGCTEKRWSTRCCLGRRPHPRSLEDPAAGGPQLRGVGVRRLLWSSSGADLHPRAAPVPSSRHEAQALEALDGCEQRHRHRHALKSGRRKALGRAVPLGTIRGGEGRRRHREGGRPSQPLARGHKTGGCEDAGVLSGLHGLATPAAGEDVEKESPEAIHGIFGGMQALPRERRHDILKLLVTAATLASGRERARAVERAGEHEGLRAQDRQKASLGQACVATGRPATRRVSEFSLPMPRHRQLGGHSHDARVRCVHLRSVDMRLMRY